MIGAIAGDIIGSVYERNPVKTENFPLFNKHSRFTDDTVLTVACAYAILHRIGYGEAIRTFARKYPRAGYGASFFRWMMKDGEGPYNSWGNGSAMRVSPVGFAFDSAERVFEEAKKSAEVTHNHPEGIKGAQSVALAVFMARNGKSKEEIRREIETRFSYDLSRTLAEIRPGYSFDVSCQGSVPEALIAFFESSSYEDAVRKGISLGGDSDTIGCIAGGIAQAFYKKMPEEIVREARRLLPDEFVAIADEFHDRYNL
jgi:ADP-ribosylglycohydrolase